MSHTDGFHTRRVVPCCRPRPTGQESAIRTLAALALAVLAATACSASETPEGAPPSGEAAIPYPVPSEVNPALLAPLSQLGECPPPPTAPVEPPSEGIALPDAAQLTSVEVADPLTNIQGYIPWTPVQLRVWYQFLSGLEIVQAEDEVFESEILLTTSDGRRLYVKSQAICSQGSVFVAISAPGDDAGQVPVPAGASTPSPSPGA